MTEYKIDLYMPYNIGHINPYLNFRVMRGRIIIEKLCFLSLKRLELKE